MLTLIAALGCTADKGELRDTAPPGVEDSAVTDAGGTTLPKDSGTDCAIVTLYYDGDGDGHGDPEVTTAGCEGLDGWSLFGDDCDDADSSVWDDCAGHACTMFAERVHAGGGDDTGDTGAAAEYAASQYWVCEQNMGWQESRQYCFDKLGGDLVAFEQDGEFTDLQVLSAALPLETLWVGINQPDTAPSVDFGWTWISAQGAVDGTSYEEGGVWHVGQPDNAGFGENTGGAEEEDVGAWVNNAGVWALMDVRIDQDMWPLCEVAVSEKPTDSGGSR